MEQPLIHQPFLHRTQCRNSFDQFCGNSWTSEFTDNTNYCCGRCRKRYPLKSTQNFFTERFVISRRPVSLQEIFSFLKPQPFRDKITDVDYSWLSNLLLLSGEARTIASFELTSRQFDVEKQVTEWLLEQRTNKV